MENTLSRLDILVLNRHSAALEKYNSRQEETGEILVSNNEAARLLNKSPQTIWRWLKEGKLKRTTMGCSSGIRLSEIYSL